MKEDDEEKNEEHERGSKESGKEDPKGHIDLFTFRENSNNGLRNMEDLLRHSEVGEAFSEAFDLWNSPEIEEVSSFFRVSSQDSFKKNKTPSFKCLDSHLSIKEAAEHGQEHHSSSTNHPTWFKFQANVSMGPDTRVDQVLMDNQKGPDIQFIMKQRQTKKIDLIRLKNELECLKRVKGHKNIVNLVSDINEDGKHFLVMEDCSGESIIEMIRRNSSTYSELKAISIMMGLLETLSFLEDQRVIHGKINTETIILNENTFKLVGFGNSATYESLQSFLTSKLRGNPLFFSPETLSKGLLSTKSDVWSAGTSFQFNFGIFSLF